MSYVKNQQPRRKQQGMLVRQGIGCSGFNTPWTNLLFRVSALKLVRESVQRLLNPHANKTFPAGLISVVLFCFVISGISAQQKTVLAVFPESARPGDPLTIVVSFPVFDNLTASIIDTSGKQVCQSRFFALPSGGNPIQVSITAIPSTVLPGNAKIVVKNGSLEIGAVPLVIETRDFVSEEIPLNESNTAIRTEPDPQKTKESQILWQILSTTGKEVYCNDPAFILPVESTRRTSFYGDRRVYLYSTGKKDTSIHAGVDFGVPRGTPVKASASGKVVLAVSRIVTGNSVIIEHFPGVYSIYYHLDKINAQEGTMVSIGTVIGLSGSTGLSTGPHLHWEIRTATENADPDAFLARNLLDKEAIIGKINLLLAD